MSTRAPVATDVADVKLGDTIVFGGGRHLIDRIVPCRDHPEVYGIALAIEDNFAIALRAGHSLEVIPGPDPLPGVCRRCGHGPGDGLPYNSAPNLTGHCIVAVGPWGPTGFERCGCKCRYQPSTDEVPW